MNEPIPYPQEQPQTPFAYPMPMASDFLTENSLKYQLDVESFIEELGHQFLGDILKVDKNTGLRIWEEGKEKRRGMINKEGWEKCATVLRIMLDKDFKLTVLDQEVCVEIALDIHDMIWQLLEINYMDYDIQDPVQARIIASTMAYRVYVRLKASEDGEYLTFLKTVQKVHEIQSYSQMSKPVMPQQQKGVMSRLPIIGRMFG